MSKPRANFLTARVHSFSSDSSIVTAVVSASTINREEQIVLASAFQELLPIYESNPILLFGHPWVYNELPPPGVAIGQAVAFRIHPDTDDGGGFFEVDFDYAADVNPTAEQVLQLVRRKVLRAYSIGWYPRESVTRKSPPEQIDRLPRFAREALLAGQVNEVHTKVELFEISQVFVGMSREALAVMQSLRASIKEDPMRKEFGIDPEEVVAAAAPENAKPNQARAHIGHAPTNDIVARLAGCIQSLSSGYYEPSVEPPERETCFGVKRVLEAVIEDLMVLAAADDDDTALAPEAGAAPNPRAPKSHAGKKYSASTRALMAYGIACHAEGIAKHNAGIAVFQGMLDEEEQDEFDDDGGKVLDDEAYSNMIKTLVAEALKAA